MYKLLRLMLIIIIFIGQFFKKKRDILSLKSSSNCCNTHTLTTDHVTDRIVCICNHLIQLLCILCKHERRGGGFVCRCYVSPYSEYARCCPIHLSMAVIGSLAAKSTSAAHSLFFNKSISLICIRL